jgi:hypothetical protein
MDVLEQIVIPDLLLLERGISMEISGVQEIYIGSIFAVYGTFSKRNILTTRGPYGSNSY